MDHTEDVLDQETIDIERKRFELELRSNARGKFLRISEVCDGRKPSRVIVPESGIREFIEAIEKVSF